MVMSVYERVLGARIDELAPSLRRYVGMPPDGMVGHGTGVYEVAGSRHRWLRPMLWWLGWRHVLFAEYGHRIPFTVVNSPDAVGTLSARRTFAFPRVTRVMDDTMFVVDGRLHDRLGRRRGLEVELLLSVVDAGLVMSSGRQWLHLGRARVPLPRLVRVALDERAIPGTLDGHTQRVEVRMTAPLLGEVFRYAGTFSYSYIRH
ncbi:MAG TPA: DUF4166 domain-containing protein [Pseudolysinimonas sp.]|nr:DUF4166 domain-containing protein [Pseudolysinimonas sp.]